MAETSVTEFFLKACEVLQYSTSEVSRGVWEVVIPENLEPLTGLERTFEVTDLAVRSEHLQAEFLDKRSFALQRVGEALQGAVLPVTAFSSNTDGATDPNLVVVFWVKCSVAATDTVQQIFTIGVDLESGIVVTDDAVTALLSGRGEEKRMIANENTVADANDTAIDEARKRIKTLVDQKYSDMRHELINETARVEAYYNAMKQESEPAARSSGKTKGLLKDLEEERKELLAALSKKYSRASMVVKIEILGLALVERVTSA